MASEPKLDEAEIKKLREVITDHDRRKWLRALARSWTPWAIGALGMFSAGGDFFKKIVQIFTGK